MSEEVPWHAVKSYKEKFTAKAERRLLSQIETVLADEMTARNAHRDTEHLHPSEVAKTDWCPRSTYFKITDTEESNPDSFNLRRMNIFQEGNDIHDKWQRWMWKAGGLVGNWQCKECGYGWMAKSPAICPDCTSHRIKYKEVAIRNDEYKVIGHADGEWEDDRGRALIEIKSIGLGTIRWDAPGLYSGYEAGDLTLDDLWKRIKRPFLPHMRQINLYMYFRGLSNAIVIYEFKPTQEVKEFHLSLNMEVVQPMLDGMKDVLDALDDEFPPPRPEGFMKSKQCRFCNYKDMCWKMKGG